MNEYTLYYFDVYGRGEAARIMLSHAGVPFQDKRVADSEWPTLKSQMPGGTMPCLELSDGTKMGQSKAIMRYLGGKHGYQPHDALAAYKSDSISDAYHDFFPLMGAPLSCNPALKSQKIGHLFSEALP